MSGADITHHKGFSRWIKDTVCLKVPSIYSVSDMASTHFISFLSWMFMWACYLSRITRGAGDGRWMSWPAACCPVAHIPVVGHAWWRTQEVCNNTDFRKQLIGPGVWGWMSKQGDIRKVWDSHLTWLLITLIWLLIQVFYYRYFSETLMWSYQGFKTPEALPWPNALHNWIPKINSYHHLKFLRY